jgi:hypothetical protein
VLFVVLCLGFRAFAIQATSQANAAAPANTTQPTLPAITFSSVGPVSSVQMSGTVNWSFGGDQQTGTVTLQANANGQNTMQLQLASGSRTEVQNPFSDSLKQCSWSGSDAVVHKSSAHQCWLDAVWFLPQITMQTGAGAPDDVATSAQPVVANTVRIHHERNVADVDSAQTGLFIAHLSAVDLDIDSTTGLPVQMSFAVHPDNDAGIDLPVEVHYSVYSTVSGVTVPTHIQKFINHSLVLDLQISGVQVQLATPAAPSSSPALQ